MSGKALHEEAEPERSRERRVSESRGWLGAHSVSQREPMHSPELEFLSRFRHSKGKHVRGRALKEERGQNEIREVWEEQTVVVLNLPVNCITLPPKKKKEPNFSPHKCGADLVTWFY